LWLRQDKPVWWIGVSAASLALFAWLLTLHPTDNAGRIYAAYGGVYIAASLLWMYVVEKHAPSTKWSNSPTWSHDLRAPLRAMQGYSNALIEDFASEMGDEARSYLHRIADNATRLEKMISDILTFTRVSRDSPLLTKVSLLKLVQDVIDHYPGLSSTIACQAWLPRTHWPYPVLGVEKSKYLLRSRS
jgi:hypothetical protein